MRYSMRPTSTKSLPPFSFMVSIALIGSVIFGCRLDYESARVAEEIPEDVPETEILRFEYQVVRRGRKLFTIHADRAVTYQGRDEKELENVSFQEWTADGAVAAEGHAEYALFDTDTEDVVLEGSIYFYSHDAAATIRAEYLYWDRGERTLHGRDDEIVEVKEDDGSSLRGRGFTADMTTRELSFAEEVSGRLVTGGEDGDNTDNGDDAGSTEEIDLGDSLPGDDNE